MRLGTQQKLFARLMGEFIAWIYEQGYEVTFGDFYRDSRVFGLFGKRPKNAYGRKHSLHKRRLAGDLNLFIDGVYQETTESHRPLGEKWESMHPLCRWGGHFNDGNHYSMEYQGYR